MAKKFAFDSSISKDIMTASSDSFIDDLKMIDVSKIVPSRENFYELSEIEILADDIERQGLMSVLVVSDEDEDIGTYTLISGHRRLRAIKELINSGRRTSKKVPCYISGNKTKTEAQLNLIMLNATQRKYSDADTMQEYEELERIFRELEAEGKGLKGRMRENIAKALNVSPAQIGKIENIKKNAIDEVTKAVSSGEMSISTANEVAKLEPVLQKNLLDEKKPAEITNKEVKQIQQKTPSKPEPPVVDDNENYDEDFERSMFGELVESNEDDSEICDDFEENCDNFGEYSNEAAAAAVRKKINTMRLANKLLKFSENPDNASKLALLLDYDEKKLREDIADVYEEIMK